jgi:hypothetical protein
MQANVDPEARGILFVDQRLDTRELAPDNVPPRVAKDRQCVQGTAVPTQDAKEKRTQRLP